MSFPFDLIAFKLILPFPYWLKLRCWWWLEALFDVWTTALNLLLRTWLQPSYSSPLSLSLSLSLSHTHTLSLLLSSMCYPLYRWNVNGKREKNHLLLFNLLLLEIDAEPLSSIFHTHSPLFFFNELSSSLDCSLAHSHTQLTAEHAFASSGSVSRRYKKSFEGWSGINPMNWNLVFKRVE